MDSQSYQLVRVPVPLIAAIQHLLTDHRLEHDSTVEVALHLPDHAQLIPYGPTADHSSMVGKSDKEKINGKASNAGSTA